MAAPIEHVGPAGPAGPVRAGPPLLEVCGLVVARAGRRILEVDALAIREGETLAVVGPNGAGKSTLLLALARLLRPEQGEISYEGSLLAPGDDLVYRRRIGLVLPAPLLLSVSVFDNVAAGLRFRGVARAETRERVDHWLAQLSILHLRDRPARQLSTGEAQRASLARSLVLEPRLLLLDEPFASLDPATRAQLTDDFERIQGGMSASCILVTHDFEEAVRLGDRMAVLLEGRIRQCDTPDRVVASPADEQVAAFLGSDTRVRGRVVAAQDGLVVIDTGSRRDGDPAGRGEALLRSVLPPRDTTGDDGR